ncbi:MAG: hypothetical protein M1149_05780 [Candidatus Thermoplasmatota archaeon]|nr:hypothetical protein [Candidatus Thermoplasmatota archaeon]
MTDFMSCFKGVENEEEAAECVHCLKKYGEIVMFSREKGRLELGREAYDQKVSAPMEHISRLLNIHDLESYREADEKFNLTMY